MAAFYTEDAKLLPPDAPIVSGEEGDREILALGDDALGLTGVTLETVDLEVSGDTAYEVGQADLSLSSGQAKVKYLVVWTGGGDGQWRLHRDIWNNMPPS